MVECVSAVTAALRQLEAACAAREEQDAAFQARLEAEDQRLKTFEQQYLDLCRALGEEIGREKGRSLVELQKLEHESNELYAQIAGRARNLNRSRWDALVREAAAARVEAVRMTGDWQAMRLEVGAPTGTDDPLDGLRGLDRLGDALHSDLDYLESGNETFDPERHLLWLKVSPGVAPLIKMLALPGVSRAHFAVEAAYRREVLAASQTVAYTARERVHAHTTLRRAEVEAWFKEQIDKRADELTDVNTEKYEVLSLEVQANRERLTGEHTATTGQAQDVLRRHAARLEQSLGALEREPCMAAWGAAGWASWTPATASSSAIRLGQRAAGSPSLRAQFPQYAGLALPELWSLTADRPLLFSVGNRGREAALGLLVRLLASQPPGRLRFTVIDPARLGQSVAPLLPLLDLAPELLGGKILSDPQEIEKAVGELTDPIERVIQKCLRHEFADLAAYNAQAGEVAEPYRVLAVWDFPTGWSETALRRLLAILRNGPRCGVQTILVADHSAAPAHGITWDEMRALTQEL